MMRCVWLVYAMERDWWKDDYCITLPSLNMPSPLASRPSQKLSRRSTPSGLRQTSRQKASSALRSTSKVHMQMEINHVILPLTFPSPNSRHRTAALAAG